jgi:hypothetical protein
VAGKDDRPKPRRRRASLSEDFKAAGLARKAIDLDRQEVGLALLDEPDRFATPGRLADDLDADSVENELDRVEPDRMWIEQDRSKGGGSR